jgi:hypothetical protein
LPRLAQIRAVEPRTAQVGIRQLPVYKDHPAQIGAIQSCPAQVGPFQIGPIKIGAAQI